jgi:hypothetical protein
MKVSTPARFFLLLFALFLFTPAAIRAQDARSTLTNLPESQAVMYINARRLINEAAPAVVPPDMLNKALDDARKFIDLNGLDYVIAGARLRGEVSLKNPPEFLFIVRGNFSADDLLAASRLIAGQGMYVQETYNGKTLNVFTLNKPATADGGSSSDQPSKKFPLDQLAAVALDANTLAIGIPSYLRDAIDAATGGDRARLKPELVDLALRDANTLISVVTDLPPGFSQHLRALGAPPNAELDRMIDALRQVQLAVNMQPSTFGVQSILRMDSPEAATTLGELVNTGVSFVKKEIARDLQKKSGGDRDDMTSLLRVMETLTNTTNNNEIVLGLTFQQASLAEVIKRQMATPKKKQETAIASKPDANKGAALKRRRTRARRR